MAMGTQPPTFLLGTGLVVRHGAYFCCGARVLLWGTGLVANTVSVGHYDFRDFFRVNTRHPRLLERPVNFSLKIDVHSPGHARLLR